MTEKPDHPVNITIKFTEQQMELVNRLAKDTGTTVPDAVANAVQDFVRREGSRYSR